MIPSASYRCNHFTCSVVLQRTKPVGVVFNFQYNERHTTMDIEDFKGMAKMMADFSKELEELGLL